MYSIKNNEEKCIGQYIYIRNNKYSIKVLTKFYNLFINHIKDAFPISEHTIRDLIKMNKYNLENTIRVYDLSTNTITLKELKIGHVAIYLHNEDKMYIVSEDELHDFLETNNYTSELSMTYIIGIQDEYKFKKVRPILASNVNNAKEIYKEKFNINEEPVCIGVKEYGILYINLNGYLVEADIDEEAICKYEV